MIIQIISHFTDIHGLWLYLESFVILLSFIPIIRFIKKYIPVLYGKSRL